MQHDFPKQVPCFQTLVCFRRIAERIFRGDRHPKPRCFDRRVEALELADAGNVAVERHAYAEPRFRKRLHTIQIRDSAAAVLSKCVDTTLKRIATGESQHRIDTMWRESLGRGGKVRSLTVHYDIGAQATNESQAFIIRRGCEHFHPTEFGELNCEGSDPARGTMYDQCVAGFQFQHVVDTLKSRKPTDCKDACFGGVDSLRYMCNVLGSVSHILCVEGTARTVDLITHFEAADAGSNGGDCASTIRSQD